MNAVVEIRADHKSIFTALAAAMSDVKRLEKESRNVEQKYNFASVDDFLSMTGPICAKHGLIVLMEEDEVIEFERQGKYGQTFWLRIRFVVTVCHVSGECLAPSRRTVEVIRTGAQSFGSAQSYALKQFLRALLQIPTGDAEDADFSEKGEGRPAAGGAGRGKPDEQRSDTRKQDPKPQYDPTEDIAAIEACTTGKDLLAVLKSRSGMIHKNPLVAEARVETIRRLVKGAQGLEQLAAFQKNFAPDWPAVAEDAEARRAELEEAAAEAAEAAKTTRASDVIPDDEIPY